MFTRIPSCARWRVMQGCLRRGSMCRRITKCRMDSDARIPVDEGSKLFRSAVHRDRLQLRRPFGQKFGHGVQDAPWEVAIRQRVRITPDAASFKDAMVSGLPIRHVCRNWVTPPASTCSHQDQAGVGHNPAPEMFLMLPALKSVTSPCAPTMGYNRYKRDIAMERCQRPHCHLPTSNHVHTDFQL